VDIKNWKEYIFQSPPKGGGLTEAFQSFFSHNDGKIRDGYGEDGCGRKVVGTERLILIQLPAFTLSVISGGSWVLLLRRQT
jgi:hypothetical protein